MKFVTTRIEIEGWVDVYDVSPPAPSAGATPITITVDHTWRPSIRIPTPFGEILRGNQQVTKVAVHWLVGGTE